MPVTIHQPTPGTIDAALLERWRKIPPAVAADLVRDHHGNSVQIDPAIKALCPPGQQPLLFGRAVTALCQPPDFGPVLYAVDLMQPGDVLIIAAEGHAETAMIGEIVCSHIKRIGGVGVVCDGAIRDVGEIAKMQGFSAFSRHVTPRGPTSAERGAVNAAVTIGGRLVSPGDLVIGDDDGLVSLSLDSVTDGIAACENKIAKESEWEASLAGGRSMMETFNLPTAG